MTTYQRALELGLTLDHYSSDLYVKDCKEAAQLVLSHEFPQNCTKFRSRIDGEIWWEIPFAYDPWWDARKR
jgi:hypothetical protein